MAIYDLYQMQKKLEKYLDENRFLHTLGVMYTCAALAMVHDCDLVDVQVAGLLHDSAKCIPNKKKLSMCAKYGNSITEFEREHPFLIHAKLGAYIAKEKYGIQNPEILSAITWHTTGKPKMSKLEKIVYVADYIEPQRDKAPHLDSIRRLAFQDLDECIHEILKDTLAYLDGGPGDIDNATREAYSYYHEIHQNRKQEEENEYRKRNG